MVTGKLALLAHGTKPKRGKKRLVGSKARYRAKDGLKGVMKAVKWVKRKSKAWSKSK
jgi:hypothetical protein